jgi:hypothetical protein
MSDGIFSITIRPFDRARDAVALCRVALVLSIAGFIVCLAVAAHGQISTTPDEKTLIVDDAPDMEVYALGKSVVVKQRAKGVLAFGGDVIVEGRIEGDVATIGGSIIQKSGAYIGGDIIAFGGAYRPDDREPLRAEGKETVMFGAFEEELRGIAQNPSQILSPQLTAAFFAQRFLSILFWFLVSLGLTTIAPGAVSRAVAKMQLSAAKVLALGFAAFVFGAIAVIASFRVLPDYMSVIFGLMAFTLLMLAYIFGRVVLHVSTGRLIQKRLSASLSRSETLAILAGVVVWTAVRSLPYRWILALFALFAGGIGLVVTSAARTSWRSN